MAMTWLCVSACVQALVEKRRPDGDVAAERNQPFYNMVCALLVCIIHTGSMQCLNKGSIL